ncbi:SMI1/KNR4 family protein [Superficieibacter electus]|uniref:SMI1/KNR4 family protein n=1 Tax=Superficieibacter electus TaxID=2022662 RepID=A0A2P5GPL2_9ENTR|nr:SMI1/KNR4 family protein [Superficieibacter electus]POP45228.1 SMI1/KNR4 family protein [Superficieibacter electus]POP48512.1 SMI1/KNR4 family protein [Superficieibacter electus]
MNRYADAIKAIENDRDILFPPLYRQFLSEEIKDNECYEILAVNGCYVCFYNAHDLVERNETYQIHIAAPHYFMIGQDGNVGYFVRVEKHKESDEIVSVDLGALGSIAMDSEASDIYAFRG